MAALRAVLMVVGLLLAVFGTFFALQGAGVIMWPAESFMLANRNWVTNGLVIAAFGLLLVWLSRRVRPRG
ncbi:hypothetical protein A6F68_02216 [Tsuneonella dongtanensis]|uniref:Uncharacterized protein n=1 Tax=Tsuneonella dongtanensis TaxID=692370 RepID=A0A1B2AF13_9SPHN|nr:hypothetical protein [Tsuneonella dongtanensis]ANY20716.1 hypothetical protein A6F68_02216 [Tsuneonella dongtanensis]